MIEPGAKVIGSGRCAGQNCDGDALIAMHGSLIKVVLRSCQLFHPNANKEPIVFSHLSYQREMQSQTQTCRNRNRTKGWCQCQYQRLKDTPSHVPKHSALLALAHITAAAARCHRRVRVSASHCLRMGEIIAFPPSHSGCLAAQMASFASCCAGRINLMPCDRFSCSPVQPSQLVNHLATSAG